MYQSGYYSYLIKVGSGRVRLWIRASPGYHNLIINIARDGVKVRVGLEHCFSTFHYSQHPNGIKKSLAAP